MGKDKHTYKEIEKMNDTTTRLQNCIDILADILLTEETAKHIFGIILSGQLMSMVDAANVLSRVVRK